MRTVVWLDELERYLDEPAGLPVGIVRSLLTAGVVVVGTLWPGEYASRVALRPQGNTVRSANDRQLLNLARVIAVPEAFTQKELRRAEQLAGDRRIRVALDSTDVGVTQALAAGPELVRWWEHADTTVPHQCYGKAIITAALDARRVGATAALTFDYLAAAAPAYLSDVQRATASSDWFDQAVRYATTQLHGAASCLAPTSEGMGRTAGWVTADYLHQHARQIRRAVALPKQVWQALVDHHHPSDATVLAVSADRRNEPEYADLLFRRRVASGNQYGSNKIPDLLGRPEGSQPQRRAEIEGSRASRGDLEALRRRVEAKAGDEYARYRLAALLAAGGDLEELRRRAGAGDQYAASRLVDLLARQGDLAELRRCADSGMAYAAGNLAELLATRGDVEELQRRADAGDRCSAACLADLLVEQGQVDHALALLRQHASAPNGQITHRLANLLAGRGDVDELRQRADVGDGYAAHQLVRLLVQQNRIEELEQEVHAGTPGAAAYLTRLRSR